MENPNVPFVAVIGGLWQLDPAKTAAAKAAAKDIGAELAKSGFGLVVYFSNDQSLEPHVVSGYLAALPAGRGGIRVRYAESHRGQIRFKQEAARPALFEHSLVPGQDWQAPSYRSLRREAGVDPTPH